ncbi:MAG: hypothetical protein ACOVRN_00245 [Flavobacterium sp.]
MSSNASPHADCLVFKLEEYDKSPRRLDNTLYIVYDYQIEYFIIRGRRRSIPGFPSPTYSFECHDVNRLVDFIIYVFGADQIIHETLLNCKTLPAEGHDITFEMLQEADHDSIHITGYDDAIFTKERLVNILKILQNVFNCY